MLRLGMAAMQNKLKQMEAAKVASSD
jgi:hypothetical protein